MRKYRLISKKGEGTFSEVLKAQSIKNGNCYAMYVRLPRPAAPRS